MPVFDPLMKGESMLYGNRTVVILVIQLEDYTLVIVWICGFNPQIH
jgi:hypothetical protein